MNKLDILICILPKLEPKAPTVGPNLLKSHLREAGYSCHVHDLNIELYRALETNNEHETYYKFDDHVFAGTPDRVSEDFATLMSRYQSLVDRWIEYWRSKSPTYIGLSVFSSFSQQMALYLSQIIRDRMPGTKVVWGGTFVTWAEPHKESGLIDHYIYGDAEDSVVALLDGNLTAPGIDSIKTNQYEMNKMLVPDYSDIKWEQYEPKGNMSVYLTASRGCVRKCTFCNVRRQWPNFSFRSGENVAKELIAIRKDYSCKSFFFTDSLINGSLKAFRDMMKHLAEYRKVDRGWSWLSQFIARPKSMSPESDFALMKESGCSWLDIGVESFSEEVRYHMGKKFSNDDLLYTLDMMRKYGIGGTLMGFIGYPTETEEDHQITLNMLRKLHAEGYFSIEDESKIIKPGFIGTMLLDPTQPLFDMIKPELKWSSMIDWEYRGNTLEVRTRRLMEYHELVEELIGDKYLTDLAERNKRNYKDRADGKKQSSGTAF